MTSLHIRVGILTLTLNVLVVNVEGLVRVRQTLGGEKGYFRFFPLLYICVNYDRDRGEAQSLKKNGEGVVHLGLYIFVL